MPTTLELLQEAHNRGLQDKLSGEKRKLYDEAVRRGFIKGVVEEQQKPELSSVEQWRRFRHEGATALSEEGKRRVSGIVRPILEAGGATVGATVVGGATLGAGTIVGGAGGFAAGATLANRMDEFLGLVEPATAKEATVQSLKDIRTGATYEMGGPLIGPIAKGGAKLPGKIFWGIANKTGLTKYFKKMKALFPNISNREMLVKAKESLQRVREGASPETIAESERVLKGLDVKTQASFSQISGSQKSARQEAALTRRYAELDDMLKQRDKSILEEGKAGVEKQFGQKGGPEDVSGAVESRIARLKGQAEPSAKAIEKELTGLRAKPSVQDVGEDVVNSIRAAEKPVYKEVKDLFDSIPPDIVLDGNVAKNAIKTARLEFKKRGGGGKAWPRSIVRQINKYLKNKKQKGKLTFDQLRDLRSQIGEELRGIWGQPQIATADRKRAKYLKILQDGIDDSLNQVEKLGGINAEAAITYKAAKAKYLEQYINRFRGPEISRVTQPGPTPSTRAVPYSQVPQRFFGKNKMDAADELIRAVGKNKATVIMDDYVGMEFISKFHDPGGLNAKAAAKWVNQHREILNKYGLTSKYANIAKKQAVADYMLSRVSNYEKTVASKIIGTDLDQIIPRLFSQAARKQSASVAMDLINLPGIKGNKSALNGIRNAVKDYYLREIHKTGDPLGSINNAKKILTELGPALKVFYKDNPQQLGALKNYHSLLDILRRPRALSRAGGSQTAEKLSSTGTLASMFRNAGQMLAVARGKGWYVSSFINLLKSVITGPARYSEQQVDALLAQAMIDPQIAQTIMMATRRGAPQKIIHKRIRNHLAVLGLYEIDRAVSK